MARWFSAFLFAILSLVNARSAAAAVYYVSTLGDDDNNPGSIGLPFRTLYRACHAAAPGDTIYVRGNNDWIALTGPAYFVAEGTEKPPAQPTGPSGLEPGQTLVVDGTFYILDSVHVTALNNVVWGDFEFGFLASGQGVAYDRGAFERDPSSSRLRASWLPR